MFNEYSTGVGRYTQYTYISQFHRFIHWSRGISQNTQWTAFDWIPKFQLALMKYSVVLVNKRLWIVNISDRFGTVWSCMGVNPFKKENAEHNFNGLWNTRIFCKQDVTKLSILLVPIRIGLEIVVEEFLGHRKFSLKEEKTNRLQSHIRRKFVCYVCKYNTPSHIN